MQTDVVVVMIFLISGAIEVYSFVFSLCRQWQNRLPGVLSCDEAIQEERQFVSQP